MVGRYSGFFYGIASGLFWGLDAVAVAWVLSQSGMPVGVDLLFLPLCVIALHDICSAFWMILLTTWRGQWHRIYCIIKGRRVLIMLLAAWCGGPIGMSCYVLSIHSVGPGVAAVVSSVYPALGVLFAVLLGRDRLKGHMIAGLSLAMLSTASLSWSPWDGSIHMMGILFALCCAVGWGVECVICSCGFAQDIDPDLALQLRQLVSGLTYMCVVLPLFGVQSVVWELAVNMQVMGAISLVAFMGTLSYLFYYRAIAQIGPIRAMGLNITYSAWAVFFGFCIMGNSLSLWTLLVAVFVIAGSLWTAAPWITWYHIWRRSNQ